MYQPQLEAEKSLIGGLLIAPEYIPHVAGEIETDDFYLDESKLAFEAMLALYQDNIRLQPENDFMEPIIVDSCEIIGKVIGLIRINID